MSFFERIQSDMYQAMKAGEKSRSTALRSALARLKDQKIEKRSDLTEAEEIKILQTLVKQRRESITAYEKGGRDDLVQQESFEISVYEKYLPQMMTPEEIKQLVQAIVRETGAGGLSDIGRVMPLVMQRGAGRIDGKTAQQLVREALS